MYDDIYESVYIADIKTGKKIKDISMYTSTWSFSEGLACVKLNEKYGFIDSGKEVISLKYDNAWNFSEGLACVKTNNKWGYINNKGIEIISAKYDKAGYFKKRGKLKLQ